MAVTTGQITLVDYNDAIQMSGYISANSQKTQLLNKDDGTYTPDWEATPLVMTPIVFSSSDITTPLIKEDGSVDTNSGITKIIWYKKIGTSSYELKTITDNWSTKGISCMQRSTNLLSAAAKAQEQGEESGVDTADYTCQIYRTYRGIESVLNLDFGISKVVNGSGIAAAVINATALSFKNGEGDPITLTAKLYRGVEEDSTVNYSWTSLGTGSQVLSSTNTLEVTPAMVTNIETFTCIITDTETGKKYSDAVTITDISDPITTVITSSNGTIFKNSTVQTTLVATLYQNGADIASNNYYFLWEVYNSQGQIRFYVCDKAGDTVTIYSDMVSEKAIVNCKIYTEQPDPPNPPSGESWLLIEKTGWYCIPQ